MHLTSSCILIWPPTRCLKLSAKFCPFVLLPSLTGRGGEGAVDALGRRRHVGGQASVVLRHFISKTSCVDLSLLFIFNNEYFLPIVILLITQNRSRVAYGVGVSLSPGFSSGVAIQLFPSLVE